METHELHGPASERSCRHIEFEVDGTKVRYEAGDHVGVFPTNSVVLVERLGSLLSVKLETVFKLIDTDGRYKQFYNKNYLIAQLFKGILLDSDFFNNGLLL